MIARLIPRSLKERLKKYILSQKPPGYRHGYLDSSGKFRSNTIISDTVFLDNPQKIKIADYVHINHYSYIDGSAGLQIGEGTQIGAWVGIYTHSSHLSIRLEGRDYYRIAGSDKKAFFIKPIKIGQYVFIGNGSLIMPGVTIGDGCFIKPQSLVMSDIPPRSVVKGNPAKVVGRVDTVDAWYLKKYPQLKKTYYDQNFVASLEKPPKIKLKRQLHQENAIPI